MNKYSIAALFTALLFAYRSHYSSANKGKQNFEIKEPTLFIHGYAGNYFSFVRMIKRFERKKWGKKNCTIIVSPKGKILIKGEPKSLIQVLFLENRDIVDHQVNWIWKILNILKNKYGISSVNIVAHSMGCISILKYLNQFAYNSINAHISKVVTMGAPFNDVEVGKRTPYIENHRLTNDGPVKMSPLYKWMRKNNIGIPLETEFLNIAGNLQNGTKSDGQVSVNSVLSLRYLLRDATRQYHEFIVYGKHAAHSLLHENEDIDNKIEEFLR